MSEKALYRLPQNYIQNPIESMQVVKMQTILILIMIYSILSNIEEMNAKLQIILTYLKSFKMKMIKFKSIAMY